MYIINFKNRAAALVLIFSLVFSVFGPLPYALAYNQVSGSSSVEPVAEGVTLERVRIQTTEGVINVYVTKVDLTNPYVRVDTMAGTNGILTSSQTVTKMANNAGAVAAVNGDFFQLGEKAPIGVTISSGELISSPAQRSDMYGFGLTTENQPVFQVFNFTGSVKSPQDVQYPLFGFNKPSYLADKGSSSDVDRLNMYTPRWGAISRGVLPGLTGTVELVVEQDVVREIRLDQPGVLIPANGYVLAGHGIAGQYLTQNFQVNDPVGISYRVTPDLAGLRLAVGGQALLVDQGQRHWFSQNITGNKARTSVGASQDGKTLYLVVVEGGKTSRGMTQEELADFMISIGAWTAVNLDGGGSSTMAVRQLGDQGASLINTPVNTTQRAVPTAVGIFSTAPPGKLAGLKISGPELVIVGKEKTFTAKGYDEHYNPYTVEQGKISWSIAPALGQFTGGKLLPAGSGYGTVTASLEGLVSEYSVRVLGKEDIAALELLPAEIEAVPGETVSISVKVSTKQGEVYFISPGDIQILSTGGVGTVHNGEFTAGENEAVGELTVVVDTVSAAAKVTVVPVAPEPETPKPVPQFTDIEGNWAKELIYQMAARGIVSGYPDGRFQPAKGVTRAEFITMLANTLAWGPGNSALEFKDSVPEWARGFIAAAVDRGIVRGYADGTFQAEKLITRAEMAAMIDKALSLPVSSRPSNYEDWQQIPAWAVQAIRNTKEAGILTGSGNKFRPQDMANRAEAAAVMVKVLEYQPLIK